MTPLYQMLMGGGPAAPVTPNPMQRMMAAMQAMQNPAQFVRNAIPDLPPAIANDPAQILAYLQQTRGISNQQIQQLMQTMPRF